MKGRILAALSIFFSWLFVQPMLGQNPLGDWVRKNKKGYLVRNHPNSNSLIGYVYSKRELQGPPLFRSPHCFRDDFLKRLRDLDPDLVSRAEFSVENIKIETSSIDSFLRITKGEGLSQQSRQSLLAELNKEGVSYIGIESGQVFEIIVSSQDVIDSGVDGCREKLENGDESWIVLQALGISGLRYFFSKEDGTKIRVGGRLVGLLAAIGISNEKSEIHSLEYEKKPVYFGYVPAKFCQRTIDYRRKCD